MERRSREAELSSRRHPENGGATNRSTHETKDLQAPSAPLAGRDGRNAGARFPLDHDSRTAGLTEWAAWPAGDPGFLSGRLESGLRRPDGAVQRDPTGVRAPRGPAAGYLGRWTLVSHRVHRKPQAP